MKTKIWLLLLCILSPIMASAKISIVAAENIYGSIAQNIGGEYVDVISVLNNPNQDPHLFSLDTKTARAFHEAQVIIINGAGYDPWAEKFTNNTAAHVINVAEVASVPKGANPHLWYGLANVKAFVQRYAQELIKLDPQHKLIYLENSKKFLMQLDHLQQKEILLRSKIKGTPVTATEPIAGYLAQDLGLQMLNQSFQLSVMNDVEPSIKDRAQMLQSLKQHQVKLLIFNQQVSDPISQQMKKMAQQANIPVVGVTELLPADLDYVQWMANNIDHISQPLLGA